MIECSLTILTNTGVYMTTAFLQTMFKLTATFITVVAFASASNAQQAGQQQQPGLNSIQAQFQQIQSELARIQQATLEENPELQTQADALETLIADAMKESGTDPQANQERLQELQLKAQNSELPQEEQQALATEFQQIREDMMRAQQEAMQAEEVREKHTKFQSDMIAAMQKQNPKTEELMAQLRKIQTQIQQQQGGQPSPH